MEPVPAGARWAFSEGGIITRGPRAPRREVAAEEPPCAPGVGGAPVCASVGPANRRIIAAAGKSRLFMVAKGIKIGVKPAVEGV